MRIGELADKSGVSRDTIRFYERNGLISSTTGESDTNNYRDYPDHNLELLGFFTKARDAGMSIADLRDIIETMNGSCDRSEAAKVLRNKIDDLKTRADQIARVVTFLEQSLENR
ncbi:MerR family transcriptional regulator [Shimia thalassica]|uniref:MerR family transcriptional regulator n=1 Tax=Shimia thalassica TaxID=1715693 RepID=UPI001C08FC4B|nr:MerR family transcriptional regulator [Shimia thalassica]MBU2942286.1 MerR family transcriptional regulator [Shimia thalassica]MDO6505129.1 MerR family transcriptional regulator [Shimia thalassica]